MNIIKKTKKGLLKGYPKKKPRERYQNDFEEEKNKK